MKYQYYKFNIFVIVDDKILLDQLFFYNTPFQKIIFNFYKWGNDKSKNNNWLERSILEKMGHHWIIVRG